MDVKAKKLRREGYVTGNVFGREIEGSVPLKMQKADVDMLLKSSHKGSQIMLDLEGTQMDVLIKDVEYNPIKKQVEEIDFQALVSNEKVHSVAEVVLLNHEKVTTGVLEQLLHEIAFKALPADLVEQVQVDVSNMRVGDTLKVADLDIAKNEKISLTTDLNADVATVFESRNKGSEDEAEDAEKAETTEE